MFRAKIKRCIASLLLSILVTGAIAPALPVFAAPVNTSADAKKLVEEHYQKRVLDSLPVYNNGNSKVTYRCILSGNIGYVDVDSQTGEMTPHLKGATDDLLGNITSNKNPSSGASRPSGAVTGGTANSAGNGSSGENSSTDKNKADRDPLGGNNPGSASAPVEANPDRLASDLPYTFKNDIERYSTSDGINLYEGDSENGTQYYNNGVFIIDSTEQVLANRITGSSNSINNEYKDWLNGSMPFSIDDFLEFIEPLTNVSETVIPFSAMDESGDYFKIINDHLSNFEVSGSATISPQTLGHYLVKSFMVVTNPGVFKDSASDVKAELGPALKYSSDGTPLYKAMEYYGMTNEISSTVDSTPDHFFNASNAGVLALSLGFDEINEKDGEDVFVMGQMAAMQCIQMYRDMAIQIEASPSESYADDPDMRSKLALMKLYDSTFSDVFPYIHYIYTAKLSNGKSIEEICADNSIEADADTIGKGNNMQSIYYDSNIGTETPIDMFYSVNSKDSITSYNRETILNDIDVFRDIDESVAEIRERQRKDNTATQEDLYKDERDLLTSAEYLNSAYGTDVADITNAIMEQQKRADGNEVSIVDGEATSAEDVTINKYILMGMQYSANYVPMRTNLYDSKMLEKYDSDFLENFYYKYGFNRKALYIDTSGSSATNYYNSNGVSTGSTKICTLRDIIECGENDVTLYIDGGYYNSDVAIKSANSQRRTRNAMLKNLADDLGIVLAGLQQLWTGGSNLLTQSINFIQGLFVKVEVDENGEISLDDFYKQSRDSIYKQYHYDLAYSKEEVKKIADEAQNISNGYMYSAEMDFDEEMLKDTKYNAYSEDVMVALSNMEDSEYVDLQELEDMTEDNKDTIVMPSSFIKKYMSNTYSYSSSEMSDDGESYIDTEYSSYSTYTPLTGVAFVSLLYRTPKYYTLADTVIDNNPVFIASEKLCGLDTSSGESNQWYRNSLLNWALIKNLKANVQVDYTYCIDLDCPVYMDIFGNIVTESGIVVVPAACNATLHTAAFKNYNVAVGLYSVYGKIYSVPLTLKGAYTVLHPYFVADYDSDTYVISPLQIGVNGTNVNFDKMNFYDDNVRSVLQTLYGDSVKTSNTTTRLNWMAMVNIINEVVRGAPISNIDKEKEDLYAGVSSTQSAIVAAVKYESLLESLHGAMQNTLISIPNFATMDGIEYFVALLIKFMIVATTAVVIIFIYRDGVAGQFGPRTFWRSISAIGLTFICIIVTPAVFQLTYYAANKTVLEKEAFRILLINEEKRQTGVEVGMTSATTTDSESNEFTIQLDWISAPWWKEIEHVLYGNTVRHVTEAKLDAYEQSPVYSNSDVQLQNDGVFVSTSSLFDGVGLDYTFEPLSNGAYGIYMWNDDSEQSANFYSPYYVFLQSLVANINEYNAGRSAEDLSNYNYTTKLMSGSRIKTVGLSYNYFNSTAFMEEDLDIMRLFQIYMDENAYVPPEIDAEVDIRWALDLYGNEIEIDPETGEAIDAPEDPGYSAEESAFMAIQPQYTIGQIQRQLAQAEEYAFSRTNIFNDEDREKFRHCLWYNTGAVHGLGDRTKALDQYARDFVANNHDLMDRVTDETFIKVMALYMSVKYNQLFGIESANALEIYNLDSEDLLRLCLLKDDEAALSVSMSFPRLVYNYGGEASVYLASILSVILWVGSFIKPLCTVIVFVSVFLSIWVFRVLLRRPSANLYGYFITITLLCLTNVVHALLLKASVFLPNTGLSILGCLIFMVVGQVAYLLVLAYVTGVSLKDWSNLGYTEYEKEAMRLRSKFKGNEAEDNLSGRIKHHEDNWDYYNDLVSQHRSRNA